MGSEFEEALASFSPPPCSGCEQFRTGENFTGQMDLTRIDFSGLLGGAVWVASHKGANRGDSPVAVIGGGEVIIPSDEFVDRVRVVPSGTGSFSSGVGYPAYWREG